MESAWFGCVGLSGGHARSGGLAAEFGQGSLLLILTVPLAILVAAFAVASHPLGDEEARATIAAP